MEFQLFLQLLHEAKASTSWSAKPSKLPRHKPKPKHLKYRKDLEEKIEKLKQIIEKENLQLQYPARWIAIKLLEGDSEITKIVAEKSKSIVDSATSTYAKEMSTSCQEPCFSIIASERYALASSIAASALQQSEVKSTFSDKLEWLTTHRVLGYFTSAGVIAGLLLWTFFVGNGISNLISSGLSFIKPVDPALSASQPILAIVLNGVWGGFNRRFNPHHSLRDSVLLAVGFD